MACYKFQRWRFRTNSYGTNGRFRRNIISDGGFARYEGICPPSEGQGEVETNVKNRCHFIFITTADPGTSFLNLPLHLQTSQLVYRLMDSNGNVSQNLYVYSWYGPPQPSGSSPSGDSVIYQHNDPNLPTFINSLVTASPTYYWELIGNMLPQCTHLSSLFTNN